MANNSVRIHPLVYYQKPQVGGGVGANEKNISPVQIIFPNGGFGLGIPVKDDLENGTTERVSNILKKKINYIHEYFYAHNSQLNQILFLNQLSQIATIR